LTPTERRIALLLLKGYSHKRMARVTGTSERTVRQHSVAVYRKAGLSGRAELAGFFLDPLMLPDGR
jgi:DNA-binding CsgD family transcriptional regulator